jgi:hypothetical protein
MRTLSLRRDEPCCPLGTIYRVRVEQLKSAVARLTPGDAAVLRIERRGQFQYLAFEME